MTFRAISKISKKKNVFKFPLYSSRFFLSVTTKKEKKKLMNKCRTKKSIPNTDRRCRTFKNKLACIDTRNETRSLEIG